MKLPNFKYFHKQNAKTLDIVLHGKDVGMDSPILIKITDASRKLNHSVLAFNFPYFDRGEDSSSGEALSEELMTLQKVMDFVDSEKYEHIRLVGKSLGGIVGSFYLDKLSIKDHAKYSIVIFGYVCGAVKLKNFSGEITVIQGEKDKWGDTAAVKRDLANAKSKDINLFEIAGADHSYRNPDTKKPVFEDEAIKIYSSLK